MTIDTFTPVEKCDGWGDAAVLNGFAAFWDRELFGIEIPAWRQNVVRWVEQWYACGDGRPPVVGDMGCGAGLYARHLLAAKVPFAYFGYDHNAEVLRAAGERWKYLPHDAVHFRGLDVNEPRWPLADDSHDVIIWDTTLRFCDDPESALRESLRICRGILLIARTPLEARTWREATRYYGMATPSPNWHFDATYFHSFAQRHECYFTPRAADDELHIISRQPLRHESAIRPVPNLARAFHMAYVRERVERLTAAQPGDWAIFGGGTHTRWLLSVLPAECRARFRIILDDSAEPNASISGVPCCRPPQGGVAAVLVSSDTIEETLSAAAARAVPANVPIHRLYESLPTGPFDKGTAFFGAQPHSGQTASAGRM